MMNSNNGNGSSNNNNMQWNPFGAPKPPAPVAPWPIPDRASMQERWKYRQAVMRETMEHRRIHTKSLSATAGYQRNIVDVLLDRETFGSSHVTALPPHRRRGDRHSYYYSDAHKRRASPATVFDSPVSTAAAASTLYSGVSPDLATGNASAAVGGIGTPIADRQPQPQHTHQHQHPPHQQQPQQMQQQQDHALEDSNHASNNSPSDSNMNINNSESSSSSSSLPHSDRPNVFPQSVSRELVRHAEHVAALQSTSAFLPHLGGNDELDAEGHRPTSSRAVSTISVAFAHSGLTMASTHGDHSVKISCCHTGRLLSSLEGHPRTPWTVKYHPTDANIVASGCLGYQVRVWHWPTHECLQMVRLEFAIISLSFHPKGDLLAIANGTRLHFWGVNEYPKKEANNTNNTAAAVAATNNATNATTNDNNNNMNTDQSPPSSASVVVDRSSLLTEIDQRHMLRCVHFPPGGNTLIIGGVNHHQSEDMRRRRGGEANTMSFYLRLWDFDANVVAMGNGNNETNNNNQGTSNNNNRTSSSSSSNTATGMAMARRAISNPRTFVPRALLYNDGGFDVSPDGKTLCACAEYWLPEGVDNAMELMQREEVKYQAELADAERKRDAAHQSDQQTPQQQQQQQPPRSLERLSTKSPLPNGPETPVQTPTRESASEVPPPPRIIDSILRTPDNPSHHLIRRLSPPSPPGQRYAGGLRQVRPVVSTTGSQQLPENNNSTGRGVDSGTTPPPPPPPPPPPAPGGPASTRPIHPLSMITRNPQSPELSFQKGRYVPHVVTISLDTNPIPAEVNLKIPRGKSYGAVAKGYRPRLGQLIEACPLDGTKASAVTCVKFSPSTDYCLIGYGVREPVAEGGGHLHPVTALYRIPGGMTHVSTMLSGDDDVNIARFHPDSGHGYVYGTKQGRVRVLSPRTWMYYNCE